MFLIGISISIFVCSFILYLLTSIIPLLRLVFLDWIALVLMFVPSIIILFRIYNSRCWKQVDRIPKWKHLIKYLRRDNETVEVLGERAYPGESFVDVPLLGLVEFLGKDCYYSCGDKKYAWVLENMNFTPDPRYSNFTHILWNLGFSNSDEIKQVLQGLLPDLRDKVYENMGLWDNGHGVNKLTKELKEYEGKPVQFKPSPLSKHKHHSRRHDEAVEKIDSIVWRK